MKRTYIITFNPFGNFYVGVFHDFLNASPEILNWLAPGLPGVVIIVSHMGLNDMAALISEHMNGRNHMIAEANANSINGWLAQDVWNFISNAPEAPPLKQPVISQPSLAPAELGTVTLHPAMLRLNGTN